MLNGLYTDVSGNNWWYKDGKLHCEDGPAIKYVNGSEFWFLDGKQHRADGPANVFADGRLTWFLHGEWLGGKANDFWKLWDRLTDEQRGNPNLLRYLPR